MESLHKIIDGKIDFQGQRLADRIMQEAIIASAILAFIIGYQLQSMQICFGIFTSGFALATIFYVPPWPYFNKYHVEWLPNREKKDDQQDIQKSLK